MKELITIKILPQSKEDLNVIAAMTGDKQYEVVEKLAARERVRVSKLKSSKK